MGGTDDVRATCRLWRLSGDGPSLANLLMRSAVAAHAAMDVRGIGAVFQVFSSACRQSSLELLEPLVVGPGKPKYLVRGQPKITEHRPERLARMDRV